MIMIITKNKIIKWNYKRLLKHLVITAGFIYFIAAYLYVSNMDYLTLIGK